MNGQGWEVTLIPWSLTSITLKSVAYPWMRLTVKIRSFSQAKAGQTVLLSLSVVLSLVHRRHQGNLRWPGRRASLISEGKWWCNIIHNMILPEGECTSWRLVLREWCAEENLWKWLSEWPELFLLVSYNPFKWTPYSQSELGIHPDQSIAAE